MTMFDFNARQWLGLLAWAAVWLLLAPAAPRAQMTPSPERTPVAGRTPFTGVSPYATPASRFGVRGSTIATPTPTPRIGPGARQTPTPRPDGDLRSRQSVGTAGKQVTNLTRQTIAKPSYSAKSGLTATFTGQVDPNVCVLMLTPSLVSVRRGESFDLRLGLSNPRAVAIDDMTVELCYDREAVAPLAVDDRELALLSVGAPEILVDRAAGTITVNTVLAGPLSQTNESLLVFQWQAVRRTPGASIAFGPATRLTRGGRDALGLDYLPNDGTVPARVEVAPSADPEDAGDEAVYELIPSEIVANLTRDAATSLTLFGPGRAVRVGEEFHVDIWLENRANLPIDRVQAHVAFDPNLLEVVDDDEDNWIILGVNILDGPFREAFPFDLHMINNAYNGLGEIYYGVGTQEAVPLARAGTIARVRFRPKAPGATRVDFVMESQSRAFPTKITYLGEDILGSTADPLDGVRGCKVSIVE